MLKLKEANARVENAEQELKNAEESGNEERIARAKESVWRMH